MFRLQLFKIRAFTAGVFASFLAAMSRGGLMFMLIIWLQGIWLPLHGYDFAADAAVGRHRHAPAHRRVPDRRPDLGHPVGPLRGPAVRHRRHDRRRRSLRIARALPIDFPYWVFGLVLFFTGLAMASFGSPNRAGVMNSLPPEHRGAGSGMNTTFQNSAQVLSIGIFFTLMIVGLASSLPQSLSTGSLRHGVPRRRGRRGRHTCRRSRPSSPPFLGYNPVAAPGRGRACWPTHRGPAGGPDPAAASSPAYRRRRSGPACTPPSTSPSSEPGGRGGVVDPRRALRPHPGQPGPGRGAGARRWRRGLVSAVR